MADLLRNAGLNESEQNMLLNALDPRQQSLHEASIEVRAAANRNGQLGAQSAESAASGGELYDAIYDTLKDLTGGNRPVTMADKVEAARQLGIPLEAVLSPDAGARGASLAAYDARLMADRAVAQKYGVDVYALRMQAAQAGVSLHEMAQRIAAGGEDKRYYGRVCWSGDPYGDSYYHFNAMTPPRLLPQVRVGQAEMRAVSPEYVAALAAWNARQEFLNRPDIRNAGLNPMFPAQRDAFPRLMYAQNITIGLLGSQVAAFGTATGGVVARESVRAVVNGGIGAFFGEAGGIGAERGLIVGLAGLYGGRLAAFGFAGKGASLARGLAVEGGGAALFAFGADVGYQYADPSRNSIQWDETLNAATFAAIGAGLGRIGAESGQFWRWSTNIRQPYPAGVAPSFGNSIFGDIGGGMLGGLGGLIWEDMQKRPVR